MKIGSRFLILILALTVTASTAAADQSGNPEFYKEDEYSVRKLDDGVAVIMADQRVVSALAGFSYYEQGSQKKLKLISRLGFTFENIPVDKIYFFNESIATFLEGEELLPKAKKWLEENYYISKNLTGLSFEFPDNPVIDVEGYTYFSYQSWVESGYWTGSRWRRYWVNTSHWETRYVLGTTDYSGASHSVVTYGYNEERSIIVHEYIHMCGYSNKDHDRHVFTEGGARKTYNKS